MTDHQSLKAGQGLSPVSEPPSLRMALPASEPIRVLRARALSAGQTRPQLSFGCYSIKAQPSSQG